MWVPVAGAALYTAASIFFPAKQEGWWKSALDLVQTFFPAVFILAWFSGNYFRVDRQNEVKRLLVGISKRLDRDSESSPAHATPDGKAPPTNSEANEDTVGHQGHQAEVAPVTDVLMAWNELESALSGLAKTLGGDLDWRAMSHREGSLSRALGEDAVVQIFDLYQLRNELVHGGLTRELAEVAPTAATAIRKATRLVHEAANRLG